jgi:uncharacterized protein YkwD
MKRIIMIIVIALLGVGISSAQQPDLPARTVTVHQKHVYKPKPKPADPTPVDTNKEQGPAPVNTYKPAPRPAPAPKAVTSAIAANGIEAAVNAVRVAHGLPALSSNAQLRQAAINRANYMCQNNDFSHNGYEATIYATGYGGNYVGENISAGLYAGGDQQVANEFAASPHHLENIVNPNYKEQGAASIMCNPPFYNFTVPVQINVNDFGG